MQKKKFKKSSKNELKQAAMDGRDDEVANIIGEVSLDWQSWNKAVENATLHHNANTLDELIKARPDWKLKSIQHLLNYLDDPRNVRNGLRETILVISNYQDINYKKIDQKIITDNIAPAYKYFNQLYPDRKIREQHLKEALRNEYQNVPEDPVVNIKQNTLGFINWLNKHGFDMAKESVRTAIFKAHQTSTQKKYLKQYKEAQSNKAVEQAIMDENDDYARELIADGLEPQSFDALEKAVAYGWDDIANACIKNINFDDKRAKDVIHNVCEKTKALTTWKGSDEGLNNALLSLFRAGFDYKKHGGRLYKLALNKELDGVILYLYHNDVVPSNDIADDVANRLKYLAQNPEGIKNFKAAAKL